VVGRGGGWWAGKGLVLVLGGCCLVAGGIVGVLQRPGSSGAPPQANVRGVLARQAQAVLRRDGRAFLGAVDPAARGFRATERRRFGNMAEVPFAQWGYRIRGIEQRGPHRAGAQVELRYRIRGYDTEPITAPEYLTFTEHHGRWRLDGQAVTTDGTAGGAPAAAQLWDFGPVHAVHGRHSLVLGLGDRAALRGYAADADRAVPAVDAVWPGRWSRRLVLEVPGSLTQMARLLAATPATYRGIAAVTTGETGGAAPADRVIVNPDAFRELSALGRHVVVTHEATHVATRPYTTPRTPLWLSEGFADWVGYRGTGRTPARTAPELHSDVHAGRVPRGLPADADFATTRTGLPQAYEKAWLACRLIARRYGTARLTRLYRTVGRGGAVQRTGGDGTVDAAMRRVLGVGLGRFTEAWRTYVVRELG
jgi:hypothetical protein